MLFVMDTKLLPLFCKTSLSILEGSSSKVISNSAFDEIILLSISSTRLDGAGELALATRLSLDQEYVPLLYDTSSPSTVNVGSGGSNLPAVCCSQETKRRQIIAIKATKDLMF